MDTKIIITFIGFSLLLFSASAGAKIFCPMGTDPLQRQLLDCDEVLETAVSCDLNIALDSDQTVSFYLKDLTAAHRLGTLFAGQELQDKRCFSDEKLIAITWDERAKRYESKTWDRLSNRDQSIYIEYPKDFKEAFVPNKEVLCETEISNNSPVFVNYYAGHADPEHLLMRLAPWQDQAKMTPCYDAKTIHALSAGSVDGHLQADTFASLAQYSDDNHYVYLDFPKDFSVSSRFLSYLLEQRERKLLKEQMAVAAANPEKAYQTLQDKRNGDPDAPTNNTSDQKPEIIVKSGVVNQD